MLRRIIKQTDAATHKMMECIFQLQRYPRFFPTFRHRRSRRNWAVSVSSRKSKSIFSQTTFRLTVRNSRHSSCSPSSPRRTHHHVSLTATRPSPILPFHNNTAGQQASIIPWLHMGSIQQHFSAASRPSVRWVNVLRACSTFSTDGPSSNANGPVFL